ncbi:MdtA/MuxA family multidrug efflux RND transporter periplasmic adaptor subunit [Vitiosangium sp. GDMCC 1.1324]|uniref:MdtA/MuxA family multidrug efflux RND transporter periplasmic adaptor subunit n=1 Tax=Vitiosangium sp. (strain GDMCC 1.1324) TaxID=2138576 RepID=UPI00130DA831|nr:MdtA/MuxA family multidrug efflux RND transporter periplasmic adaptor subunit [Vitiosangium sp. GDMCC 1.1324]
MWLVLCLIVVAAAIAYERHRNNVASGNTSARQGGRGPAQGQQRAQPVVAATAATHDVPVYLTGLGSVTPTDSVVVRSRVDGQLMRVMFKEGQLVEAGDLLAEIDPRPFRVQLEQAQGQLFRDEALLANARVDLLRYQTLYAQDSVAKQQLDTQAALVRQYEGVVKTDQAAVDSAKLNLIYTRITTSVGGRVGLRQVDPGNIVHATDTNGIVIVNALQPINVVFSVPEDHVPDILAKLAAGQTLKAEAYDRARKQLLATGTLLTLDNQIDSTTGTIKLKASFPNHDFRLFPQQFVNAQLLIDTLHGATIIPTAAIQYGVQGTFVYVINANKTVHVRPVTTGPAYEDNTVVLRGLEPDEQVVIEGADKLTDGASITLLGPHQASQPPGVGGSGAVDGGQGGPPRDGGM